jgi:hypothetical protein
MNQQKRELVVETKRHIPVVKTKEKRRGDVESKERRHEFVYVEFQSLNPIEKNMRSTLKQTMEQQLR